MLLRQLQLLLLVVRSNAIQTSVLDALRWSKAPGVLTLCHERCAMRATVWRNKLC